MTDSADKGQPFDAGPFSMMAVAAMEGHFHTIQIGDKKYGAMQYTASGTVTPLMVFARGMLGFDNKQVLRLWVGLNKYERVYNGDWIVMLSRTEYRLLRMSQSESLFSLMPSIARNTPEGRLARIAQQHAKEVRDDGSTGFCVECDHPWPCPTYVWATEDRESVLCWDPADDDLAEEMIRQEPPA